MSFGGSREYRRGILREIVAGDERRTAALRRRHHAEAIALISRVEVAEHGQLNGHVPVGRTTGTGVATAVVRVNAQRVDGRVNSQRPNSPTGRLKPALRTIQPSAPVGLASAGAGSGVDLATSTRMRLPCVLSCLLAVTRAVSRRHPPSDDVLALQVMLDRAGFRPARSTGARGRTSGARSPRSSRRTISVRPGALTRRFDETLRAPPRGASPPGHDHRRPELLARRARRRSG